MKKLASLFLVLVLVFSFNVTVFAEESDGQTVTVSSEEEFQQAVNDENVSTILIKGSNSLTRSSGTEMILSETMNVTHDLTIKALDNNPIIIKVAGDFRHMNIYGDSESWITVDFENVILDGGSIGGGLACSYVTLNNAIVQNCASSGIYSDKIIINNSIISNNLYRGIDAGHETIVNNSIISKNNDGGIKVTSDATITINNSTISENTASCGGAIFISMSTKLTVNNSTISNNTATDSGGGIYLYSTNYVTEINESTIFGNTAEYGGGIFALTPMCGLSVLNSSINENTAVFGGGIYTSYSRSLSVDETSSFAGNKASTGCHLTNLDIIALHDSLILTKQFSEPYQEYGYNNYDIYIDELYTLLQ